MTGGGALLDVLVQPRASRDGVAGMHGGSLKVRLTAPPVDGAANEALVRFLAGFFGLPRRDVTIVSGERGRRKRVRLAGLTDEAARDLIAKSEG